MLKLAETYFRLDLTLERADKVRLQESLISVAYRHADGLFGQTPQIIAYVEDGSTKGWLSVAGLLFLYVSQYGSFRSGVDYAFNDAQEFSNRIIQEIRNSGVPSEKILRTERRTGVPGKIKRILIDIDKLHASGRDLSKSQYNQQIDAIQKKLLDVMRLVEDEEDRKLVIESIPGEIRQTLPGKLPHPSTAGEIPVALRPQEIEAAPLKSLPWSSLTAGNGLVSIAHPLIQPNANYVVQPSSTGFKIVPR